MHSLDLQSMSIALRFANTQRLNGTVRVPENEVLHSQLLDHTSRSVHGGHDGARFSRFSGQLLKPRRWQLGWVVRQVIRQTFGFVGTPYSRNPHHG